MVQNVIEINLESCVMFFIKCEQWIACLFTFIQKYALTLFYFATTNAPK